MTAGWQDPAGPDDEGGGLPEAVAYDHGWTDGWYGSPLHGLNFTTRSERTAYDDGYSRAVNMRETGNPDRNKPKRDPWPVRLTAWLAERWGR